MKSLTLIRHAKSSWTDAALPDFDRPLNSRGQRDAPMMSDRIAHRKLAPDLLLSSPARRAITTARIFAEDMGFPGDAIRTDPELYGASATELMGILRSLSGGINRVFLFGHNPGLTELSSLLDRKARIANIPTCGVVHFALKVNTWKEITPGNARMMFFDYPKRINE
jgi:phosphohistidine phosphatase